jgi:hypothetical protein
LTSLEARKTLPKRLQEIEEQLTASDIMFARSLAQVEIERSQPLLEASQRVAFESEASQTTSQSWLVTAVLRENFVFVITESFLLARYGRWFGSRLWNRAFSSKSATSEQPLAQASFDVGESDQLELTPDERESLFSSMRLAEHAQGPDKTSLTSVVTLSLSYVDLVLFTKLLNLLCTGFCRLFCLTKALRCAFLCHCRSSRVLIFCFCSRL